MILTSDLKVRVEEAIGAEICPAFFAQAEQYARRKLDLCNERAGRQYGEDGYGDDYLVLLTADTVREIEYFTDFFAVDPKNPRVEVVIEDYEGGKQNGSKNKN